MRRQSLCPTSAWHMLDCLPACLPAITNLLRCYAATLLPTYSLFTIVYFIFYSVEYLLDALLLMTELDE